MDDGYALMETGAYVPGGFAISHNDVPKRKSYRQELCAIRMHVCYQAGTAHNGYAILVDGKGILPETFSENMTGYPSNEVRVYFTKDHLVL